MTSKINHNLEIGEDSTEYTLKLNGQNLSAKVEALKDKTENVTRDGTTTSFSGSVQVGNEMLCDSVRSEAEAFSITDRRNVLIKFEWDAMNKIVSRIDIP
jgi:hypothetical protein